MVWSDGQGVNRRLRITTNQGACGKAFSEGKFNGADLTSGNVSRFNFNEEQIRMTSDLKFVLSVPLISGEETVDYVNHGVKGVLNVESSTQGSEILVKDPTKSVIFFKDIYELSKICSKLLS